jgi:YebC/PmpR family DNA-binding regulatory protein
MSGHSKWANIKNRKGAQDQKRSAAFTKMSKNIITAIKQGGNNTNADGNSYLKAVLEKAREVNMPKENITRLIDRFNLRKDNLMTLLLEGFGPQGVPIMLEVETDNKNRTLGEIRLIFKNHGGSLGEEGSVGYLFEKVGEIELDGDIDESVELELIDAGMGDRTDKLLTVDSKSLNNIVGILKSKNIPIVSSKIVMRPLNPVVLPSEEAVGVVIDMIEELEEHEEVNGVFAGFDYHE